MFLKHLLELHFFDVEIDLVCVCLDENLENAYEALVLVKESRYLRISRLHW